MGNSVLFAITEPRTRIRIRECVSSEVACLLRDQLGASLAERNLIALWDLGKPGTNIKDPIRDNPTRFVSVPSFNVLPAPTRTSSWGRTNAG